MAKGQAKLKAPGAVFQVPQTRDAAAEAIGEIGQLQRQRTRLETEMNDAMAKLKERFEQDALPLNERMLALQQGVQVYCEAHRDALTQGNKVKTASFTTGEVKWRTTPASVALKNVAATLELLKANGLTMFVRTKEEISKEAILADAEAAKKLKAAGIAGVTISSREEFVIEPFEAKLDEVA